MVNMSIAVMETLDKPNILCYLNILRNLNNFSMQHWKILKYMYAKRLKDDFSMFCKLFACTD